LISGPFWKANSFCGQTISIPEEATGKPTISDDSAIFKKPTLPAPKSKKESRRRTELSQKRKAEQAVGKSSPKLPDFKKDKQDENVVKVRRTSIRNPDPTSALHPDGAERRIVKDGLVYVQVPSVKDSSKTRKTLAAGNLDVRDFTSSPNSEEEVGLNWPLLFL